MRYLNVQLDTTHLVPHKLDHQLPRGESYNFSYKMAIEKPLQATEPNGGVEKSDETVDLGEKYEIPEPEPFISFNALKDRIRHHYELASDYYYSLWYVLNSTTSLMLN